MSKKLDYFSVTMTNLLRACFSDTQNYCFKNTAAIDFFLYMVKYDEKTDPYVQQPLTLDRITLATALASHNNPSDTPEIPIILNFLLLHLLKKDDSFIREKNYYTKSDNFFVQKSLPDLMDYCKNELGLELMTAKDLTQDSVIDIITICLLIGRHGMPFPKQQLQNIISPDLKSNLMPILNKQKTKFTIIYSNINERQSHYVLKYVLHQLHGISYSISYDAYRQGTLPGNDWILAPKYADMKMALCSAIYNSYLTQNRDHYCIIHSIPSQNDLDTLIIECKLYKNVILVCDFDIVSPQNSKFISYLPFQSFYTEPRIEDINLFFEKNHIDIDNPYELSKTLLSVSKGNLYLLHTLEVLTKHLWEKKETGNDGKKERISITERIALIEKLKHSLNTLSLEADSDMIPTEKFSMPQLNSTKRSGTFLIGHIRRLYNDILSVDEWLLLLLIALHGEEGLPEELLLKMLPQNVLNVITSLEDKNLISKENNIYFYEDSLLIPYALLYGKFSLEDDENSLFSEIFSFLNFMLNEICYHNSDPIDYGILCNTTKKTYTATFRLLYKSNDTYYEYFPKIWYYHIRYTKFLLENGDISGIKELNRDFLELEKKLTLRPKEYKHWKTLYRIYLDFLEQRMQTAINAPDSWEPYISLANKLMYQISQHGIKNQDQPDYWKLLLCFLETIISYLLRLCISGVRNCRFFQTEPDMELYASKISAIRELSQQIFLLPNYIEDKDFLSEIEISFNTIIQIADIQRHNYISPYANKLVQPLNLYAEPRYIQLSWFQKSCVMLGEQCYSGYALLDISKTSQASKLQKTISLAYIKLKTIPLDILEDYYYALINYTLAITPPDTGKLLDYIYKDLERYEHIWQHSEAMSRINDIILKFQSKNPA